MIGAVYAVILRAIIDANRLDIACDYTGRACTQRIRLAGLRAPRAGTPEGDAATAWVSAWVAAHTTADPPAIWATILGPRPPRLARFPAIIHAPDGACLNRDLLDSGHAQPH